MQELDTISTLLVDKSRENGILPACLAEAVVVFSTGARSLCVVSTVSNVVLGRVKAVETPVGSAPNVADRVSGKGGAAAGVVGNGCGDPVTAGGAV